MGLRLRVICDLEANGLDPTVIWCVVCKDIRTGEIYEFREADSFRAFAGNVRLWIGHNFLGYDRPVLNRLWSVYIDHRRVVDTLICSRLFRRMLLNEKHSLEVWGKEFGLPKVQNEVWDEWSPVILERCKQDVEINHRVYEHLKERIWSPDNKIALRLEHDTAIVCEELHDTGFRFDAEGARSLLERLERRLDVLRDGFREAFPPRVNAIREVRPRATNEGRLHRGDFRWDFGELEWYSPDAPFTRIEYAPFNPGSHRDVVDVLHKAGWSPIIKTKGHLKAEREGKATEEFQRYGWIVNEANLATLPETAPEASRKLTEWLLLEGRRRTLETWQSAYNETTGRIHGRFFHIGTWTHRMAHRDPNMGNIPAIKSKYQEPTLKRTTEWLSKVMRSMWIAEKGFVLVGVDADQIQLRILSHLMGDPKFQEALVTGDKAKSTDVHSLNAQILNLTREDAKNWIYAFCLGAGIRKLASMSRKTEEEMEESLVYFLETYPGLKELREKQLKEEAKREYVELIDGRRIWCNSSHLALAAHLQGNEQVIMKYATQLWRTNIGKAGLRRGENVRQVNFIHDEWQTEVREDNHIIRIVADAQVDSIRIAGQELGLRCPLVGNAKVGYTWAETH
jgi:DNA polymerase-1